MVQACSAPAWALVWVWVCLAGGGLFYLISPQNEKKRVLIGFVAATVAAIAIGAGIGAEWACLIALVVAPATFLFGAAGPAMVGGVIAVVIALHWLTSPANKRRRGLAIVTTLAVIAAMVYYYGGMSI